MEHLKSFVEFMKTKIFSRESVRSLLPYYSSDAPKKTKNTKHVLKNARKRTFLGSLWPTNNSPKAALSFLVHLKKNPMEELLYYTKKRDYH